MKGIFVTLCTCFVTLLQAQQADIIIRNGRILDGTGNSWYYADIAVKDGKIISIGKLQNMVAATSIDAKGLYIAPGFIDVHTHIEGNEKIAPDASSFIYDGVTSVVTGNCGGSAADIGKYLQFIDSLQLSINVATLYGHNTVRNLVMGTANRLPTAAEQQQMETLVAQAMQAGAVGLSTGLIYIPGTYSKTPEVAGLAKIAAQYNGLYATHMRDEGDHVTDAIEEALTIARAANIPLEISHFKLSGQNNWNRSKETLAMVKHAREEGIEVTIDQYPYTASSTTLAQLFPDEVLADGADSIRARIRNPATRAYIKKHMLERLHKRMLSHFTYCQIASYSADSTWNGKNIEEVNLMLGRKHTAAEEAETIIDMIYNGGASMVFHGMSEDDVKNIMQYPFNMFASDASIRVYMSGVPHPRGYGTNARVLGKYVREEKVISIEEAIRRMTSLPAQKFGLTNRGLLKEGMAADIVVFDAATIIDRSTYAQPHQYSQGMQYVLVNGKLVVENGKHNGNRPGKALYGAGKMQ
ncbi:MAG TPA: D-aminoacylase [Phnomibacter sp.]|nr:D-aminoacylase [Phnomibacter sp.]